MARAFRKNGLISLVYLHTVLDAEGPGRIQRRTHRDH
jgi:hypothetical protein